VQTGFDVFSLNHQEIMIEEMLKDNWINDCALDFNGNHVI
jgi:hypothetical protein